MVSIRTTQKKCYNDFFSEHAEYLLFFLIDLPPPNSLEGDISSKKVLFFYGPTIQKKKFVMCVFPKWLWCVKSAEYSSINLQCVLLCHLKSQ